MDNMYRVEESKRAVTAANLIRWAGLFAIIAGTLFIAIQLIHPPDQLASVSTSAWIIVACLTSVMSFSSLIGMLGMYTRQVKESGWLGLAGFLIFSLFWLTAMIFSFIEGFILPLLITDAPEFVEGFLGIFGGLATEADLGVLPALAPLGGVMYIFGGLLFGIAVLRARVLPRLAGALLAFSAVATLGASIIPHPFDRALAVPMGIALIWLGYALWSERGRSIGRQR